MPVMCGSLKVMPTTGKEGAHQYKTSHTYRKKQRDSIQKMLNQPLT